MKKRREIMGKTYKQAKPKQQRAKRGKKTRPHVQRSQNRLKKRMGLTFSESLNDWVLR